MTNAENIGENMSAGYGCGGIVFRFYNDGRMSWDGVESGTALIGPNCVETFFTALNAVPQGEVTAATLDADGHLQSMTVHRFNQATQSFYPLGTYSCTWWP